MAARIKQIFLRELMKRLRPVPWGGEIAPVSQKKLHLFIRLQPRDGREARFATLSLPSSPRLYLLPSDDGTVRLIRQEDIVKLFLPSLFPEDRVEEASVFRILRNQDFPLDDRDDVATEVRDMGSAGEKADSRFAPPLYEDGVFHLVSCASLIAIKRVTLLIDALSLWKGGRVRWLHIGGGADEADVRAYAAEKLGDKPDIEVEITGTVPREQVEQIYATHPFDVFVNTSRNEGVPVSIMEAMHAGIPVIAPAVGGIPELVDDSVGRLYPPEGGAEAVVAALTAVSQLSREEAEALRAAAQSRWNERCRSDLLLTRLFPEAAKGGDEA